MTKQQLLDYKKAKVLKYKQEWDEQNAIHGAARGTTESEWMKMTIKQKSSTTHRVHSKGNLWNHHNLPRPKANIKIWYK